MPKWACLLHKCASIGMRLLLQLKAFYGQLRIAGPLYDYRAMVMGQKRQKICFYHNCICLPHMVESRCPSGVLFAFTYEGPYS